LVPLALLAQRQRAHEEQREHRDRTHGHGQELQGIAPWRCMPGGDASNCKVERLDGEHDTQAGSEDSEPLVQHDAVPGDETRLRVVQCKPRGGDEPMQVRGEREWRQTEQELQIVSAREAHDRDRGQRGDGENGEAIACDGGVHGPTIHGPRRRDNESSLKSRLLLYDRA